MLYSKTMNNKNVPNKQFKSNLVLNTQQMANNVSNVPINTQLYKTSVNQEQL